MEIDVRRAANRADEELSLELFNAVWPRHAVTGLVTQAGAIAHDGERRPTMAEDGTW